MFYMPISTAKCPCSKPKAVKPLMSADQQELQQQQPVATEPMPTATLLASIPRPADKVVSCGFCGQQGRLKHRVLDKF